jgi:hypothetical protein
MGERRDPQIQVNALRLFVLLRALAAAGDIEGRVGATPARTGQHKVLFSAHREA